MTMRKCHQPAKTCDANRHLSARIEMDKHYALFLLLLLLMNFCVFTANAQKGQEQIVLLSEVAGFQEIHLKNGAGVLIKKLTFPGSYYTPSLSFDGERIAFVSRVVVDEHINRDIFTIDIHTGEQRQVTLAHSDEVHPSWSPDGSRIVFASNQRGADLDLYTVDKKGKNLDRLTNNPGNDYQPDWSPDGNKIAFTSEQDGGPTQVYLFDIQTGNQEKLTESNYRAVYPRWSPDGTQVAFLSGITGRATRAFREIWQVRADGSLLKSLILDGEYNDDPAFSPDGKKIAFTSVRNDNRDIYTFDVDSLQILRLTRDQSLDSQPSWSPDGKHLVFVSDRTGNRDIHRINAEGGGIVNLTQSEVDEYRPAWSPIENIIIFERKVAERRGIHVMDSNGNRQMLLDNSPFFNGFPAWSPQGDKIAFVNYPAPDTKVSRIYTIDADGQNKHLLFEVPSPRAIRKISWSPDGKKMLFVYSERSERGLVQEIRLLDVITREVNSIDLNLAESDNAVWAPFGRTIVFSAFPAHPRPAVRYGIFMVDTDGSNQETIWDTLNPEILHERFSWSPDGQRILFGRGTGSLYLITLHNRAVKLFIRNAHSPDWKTPRVWRRSVEPKDKLQTTWGEVKK